ncbi:pitrilysin family protein [Microvirga sp. W0021]|uniref:Pitrilysin family protein n=1 Tax=Hohaiivirga grylli TaxID=3133970 RepID=A0ABV0BI73_9HYPH
MNQNLFSENPVEITTLSNGFTVATEATPNVATASLGVWVGSGSRNEQASEHGLSHLIEHMAFKGTTSRSARQVAEDIENVGGEINAATGVEYTSYAARLLGEDISVALDVIGDLLTKSVFDKQELAREKSVILQEYAAVEDTPDDLIYDVFQETAFSGQPIGRPILGRPETINSFDETAIRRFLDREYIPANMALVATGPIQHAQIVEQAERLFGHLPVHEIQPSEDGIYKGGEKRLPRDLEQANIVFGLPGLSFKHKDYYALHLFAHILGGGLTSRLWHEVRETRGLAYVIDAFHWPFSDCGIFGIGAGTSQKDLAELLDVALECAWLATENISEEEMARAKRQMKVGMLTALESPGGRIERIARQLLTWKRLIPVSEVVRKVDALTAGEVCQAGRTAISGNRTLVSIGPIDDLPALAQLATKP